MNRIFLMLLFSFVFTQEPCVGTCYTEEEEINIENHISTLEQKDSLNVIEIKELKEMIDLYEQKSINETTNTMSDILFNFETGSVGEIIEILNEYPVLSARLIKESFNNNQLDDNDLEKIAVDETKKANEV